MAFFRGEEGSVSFDNGSGTVAAVVSTTGWTLDMSKDVLDVTSHGQSARTFVGGLTTATGSVDVLYTQAASSEPVSELINDAITAEDPADASFNLFIDNSNNKKYAFSAIITGSSVNSVVGDLVSVNVTFQVTGAITIDI